MASFASALTLDPHLYVPRHQAGCSGANNLLISQGEVSHCRELAGGNSACGFTLQKGTKTQGIITVLKKLHFGWSTQCYNCARTIVQHDARALGISSNA